MGPITHRVWIPIPWLLGLHARLSQAHAAVAVLVLGHWRLWILLKKFYKIGPKVRCGLHPFTHERQAEGNFDDPICDNFGPQVEDSLRMNNLLEEYFEPLWCKLTQKRRVWHTSWFQKMLEQNEEGLDFVVILRVKALTYNRKQLRAVLLVIETIVHISLG